MKKLLAVSLLFGIVSLLPVLGADGKWSIGLTGGWAYSAGGDVNNLRMGRNDYWSQAANSRGWDVVLKECAAIHSGLNLNGEALFRLTPALSIGLGVGYLTLGGSKDADLISVQWSDNTDSKPVDSSLTAVPVTLEARWTILDREKIRLFTRGGIGLYFARFHELYRDAWGVGPGSGWNEFEVTGDTTGFGLQGGLGFEYRLNKLISLVLEGVGRYAPLSGISGDLRFRSSDGDDNTDTGTLYIGERYSNFISGWVTDAAVDDAAPAGDAWRNAKEFKADFSGFALRVGIRVSL